MERSNFYHITSDKEIARNNGIALKDYEINPQKASSGAQKFEIKLDSHSSLFKNALSHDYFNPMKRKSLEEILIEDKRTDPPKETPIEDKKTKLNAFLPEIIEEHSVGEKESMISERIKEASAEENKAEINADPVQVPSLMQCLMSGPKVQILMEKPKELTACDFPIDAEENYIPPEESEIISVSSNVSFMPQKYQKGVQTASGCNLSISTLASISIESYSTKGESKHERELLNLSEDISFATVIEKNTPVGNHPEISSLVNSQSQSRSYTPTNSIYIAPFSLDSAMLYNGAKEPASDEKELLSLIRQLQHDMEKLKQDQTDQKIYRQKYQEADKENESLRAEIENIKKNMAEKSDFKKLDDLFEQKQVIVEATIDILQQLKEEIDFMKKEIKDIKETMVFNEGHLNASDKKIDDIFNRVSEWKNSQDTHENSEIHEKCMMEIDILKQSSKSLSEEIKLIKDSITNSLPTEGIIHERKDTRFSEPIFHEEFYENFDELNYEQPMELISCGKPKIKNSLVALSDLQENRFLINDLQEKLQSLEEQKIALENEYFQLPEMSRSMRTKKRKQTLELELSINSNSISSVKDKIRKYSLPCR
ncbi:unnamed protein product [Blepharisma stoltei]|uniref:Uncharacterized protein n=1 Tax=Blepharisma stoltei TaxID=1481888 RepID=A0AAU9J5T5_9CILI|nr:unnamed protein product [Blepharisma stoltei]